MKKPAGRQGKKAKKPRTRTALATRRAPRAPEEGPAATALVRLGAAETLPAAYGAWSELLVARAAAAGDRARERERLTREAGYLLGALGKAREVQLPSKRAAKPALARGDAMGALETRAKAEQETALRKLAEREKQEEDTFRRLEARIRQAIRKRAETLLEGGGARLVMNVVPTGRDRTVVHAQRLTEDESVLLCLLLNGKLPTRYAFFVDDAVDDLSLPPPFFYPDDGLTETRPARPEDEDGIVERSADFLPIRMHLPVRLPDRSFPRFRLVHRGPEAELESRREGEPYSPLVPRDDAELFSGYVLRLKVEGLLKATISVS